MKQAMDTLKVLSAAYGPSGNERKVGEVIREMVAPYADEVYYDIVGNLVAVKQGGEKKVMLAAHMDQNGFMVTFIEENGFLRIAPIGGMNAVTFINTVVCFENGVQGVLSYESDGTALQGVTFDRLYCDIGATSRESAETLVQIGDIAVAQTPVVENELQISSGALDDRAGCAILVETFRRLENCPYTVYAVFTVQEEVGCRGAQTAAYALAPDVAIALDVTLSCDTPRVKNVSSCKLHSGPAIKVKDSNNIAHPIVRRWLSDAAAAEGIAVQNEVLLAGGTDAGPIARSRCGVPAGTLSLPTRYVHSTIETVSKQDYFDCIRLLQATLQREF